MERIKRVKLIDNKTGMLYNRCIDISKVVTVDLANDQWLHSHLPSWPLTLVCSLLYLQIPC